MSRVVIKNLPSSITSDKLKERFSTKGEVTDVQLKYTRDGKFRHFAFIGFQTADEADTAIQYFNNTFINQSKIVVERCAELGDANKPKAWSKYAQDSSAYKKQNNMKEKTEPEVLDKSTAKEKKKKKKEAKLDPTVAEKLKKHKSDPMFREFLEVHMKEDSSALQALADDNDSGVDEASDDDKEETNSEEKTSSAFANISDLEYLKLKKKSSDQQEVEDKKSVIKAEVKQTSTDATDKLFTVKVMNLAYATKKRVLKDFFRPLKATSIRLPPKSAGFAYVSFKTAKEMKKALNKNKSFINGKQVGVKEYTVKEEKEHVTVKNEKQARWKEQEEALLQDESIAESGSIFVRNLPYTVSEDELTEQFAKFGPLAEVVMPVDRESRRVKGFATLTYVLPEHAVAAYTALDGSVFHGRMMHLLPAKTKGRDTKTDENTSFKEKKKEKQKAGAGQAHNWNSLFLGVNAVAEVMAETYNKTKQEVLTGPDVAVRLALGETQIVNDTRQFLLDAGVSLDAFNQAPSSRSKTVILVKNLPAKTSAVELREMFHKFGELGRVVLPPSGVTGIVEFLEPSEAKKAFLSLAYTRFKNLPLYLEWAPEHTFAVKQEKEEESQEESGDGNANVQKDEELTEKEDMEPEPDTTLYVKNLNFDSSEDGIKKHFSRCGAVANVTIARKRDPARPGELLSMGYGFVQFYRQAHVTEALKRLQNSSLDGHTLELKRSNRTLQQNEAMERKKNNVTKQTGTKILVRNLPFQATEKEVTQLFRTFGELKAVRLPRKMVGTGSHRGFAFVEFHTKHDAKRAMGALCQSTHLLGRRLVLEWAQQDDDVDTLRKRTARHFQPEQVQRSKKARADLEIENEEED